MELDKMKESLSRTNAFYGVSFDPEKRLQRFVQEFEQIHYEIVDKCQEYGIDPERFIEKHYRLAMNYLCSESRCISWAITGPARFPVAKAQKRSEASLNHLNKYVWFCDNYEKTLKRIVKKSESQDDRKEKWLKMVEQLKQEQEMMKECNKLIRQGKQEEAEKLAGFKFEPDFLGRIGFPDYKLRNNLANIKRLEQQIKDIDNTRDKCEGFGFEGGKVEFDAEEIRWNIYFDEKPEEAMRAKLKSHGFKWSPRRTAWTRGAKTLSKNRLVDILKGE